MKLIESICFKDGSYQLLTLHQQRVHRSFKQFFPDKKVLILSETLPQLSGKEKRKVRLVYDGATVQVSTESYITKPTQSIRLVDGSEVSYEFKYANRKPLEALFKLKNLADDIAIVQHNMLTDSYYANLVFWDGQHWYTPKTHLLNGIKRQFYLQNGTITERTLSVKDLTNYKQISLINAMLDLGEVTVPIERIQ